MIDIETFGASPNSIILQIGAVGFAQDGMDPGFYTDVTTEDQVHLGRKADPSTVAWWLDKTTSEARVSVFERRTIDTKSLYDSLTTLNEYIRSYLINDTHNNTKHDKLWANSPTFDLVIIRNAMEMCGITPAWKYWHEADVRTLKFIDGISQGKEFKKIPTMFESGIAHNALDDAKTQALYVVDVLDRFRRLGLSWQENCRPI